MLGAQFNFCEYIHRDLLCTQQLCLEELKISLTTFKGLTWEEALEQKRDTNSLNLAYNPSSKDLFLSLFSNEYKNKNIFEIINNSIHVIKDVSKKILHDHKIYPLRIFWVKADYSLLIRVLALISSMFSIFFIFILKNTNILNSILGLFITKKS